MQRASFFFKHRKKRKKKNTSLDASSEGASDGPTKETSKEAKLHGRQCPLQCVFGVQVSEAFHSTQSQTQANVQLIAHPSRGQSILSFYSQRTRQIILFFPPHFNSNMALFRDRQRVTYRAQAPRGHLISAQQSPRPAQ